ncbi:MAG: protein translocase subunit SecDF, partial [Pseudomonadota bacterium]
MLEFPTWKRALITILCALGIAFALPNALGPETRSAIPSWLPHQSVNLGLDLRGGAHLLLEVEVESELLSGILSADATSARHLADVEVERAKRAAKDANDVALD